MSKLRPKLLPSVPPEIIFQDGRSRLEPGIYRGYVRAIKGPYRDPHMQRWVVLLIFDVMSENNLVDVLARVQMYFNLGKGDKPKAGRRSKYFHAWCMAMGGHMRRGDRMTPRVFSNRF